MYARKCTRRTRIPTKLLTRKKTGLEKNGEQSVGRRREGDAAGERHPPRPAGWRKKRGWYVAKRNGARGGARSCVREREREGERERNEER